MCTRPYFIGAGDEAKSRTWARQYTEVQEHFRAYTDLGNQGATNTGQMIQTWIDTIILCAGAIVMINVGLAQAHPN